MVDPPGYDPDKFPPGVRAFLAALTVHASVTEAARAVAAALHPADAEKANNFLELRRAALMSPGDETIAQAFAESSRARKRQERFGNAIRRQHYERMAQQPEYKEAFEAAYRMGVRYLEDWLNEIALEGLEEAVYQQGRIVGFRRKLPIRAIELRLAKELPDEYGKKRIEHSGKVQTGFASLTDEQLERIILLSGIISEGEGERSGEGTPEETPDPSED